MTTIPAPVRIRRCRLYETRLETRLPFRYGIATVTDLPHVFVRVEADVDGRPSVGLAADHLPPKWFTKNPATSPDADIAELWMVVKNAARLAEGIGGGDSVFAVWRKLYDAQAAWGAGENLAPLLSGFGTSLVERALIDAFCRATGRTFAQALHTGALGVRLGELHPELTGQAPADLLPSLAAPLPRVVVRHTVGLSDPLRDEDIAPDARLADGLPQSLVEAVEVYGLRHFKLKVSGDPARDVDRLRAVAPVLARHAPPDYAFSLDGNEGYKTPQAFKEFWDDLSAAPDLQDFRGHLLFVEQPLHRDVALSDEFGALNAGWPDRPPVIIDESDAEIESLARALSLGYAGTSHKNCKGVFKGVANACLIAYRRRSSPAPGGGAPALMMSGEDLSNVGPVSLQQDLAVQAALGISSVERNGQHYFAGLSGFPAAIQAQALARHPDLYHANPVGGWPTMTITDGQASLASVNAAPFGTDFTLDTTLFSEAV